MKKNTSWNFTDGSFVTFQLSVSGPGEFGLSSNISLHDIVNALIMTGPYNFQGLAKITEAILNKTTVCGSWHL